MGKIDAIQRRVGKDGPMVPALGLGLMGLSVAYGEVPDDEERFKLLDRAVEMGATNWDTADLYGDSERLLGDWFQRTGKRDQIFLASKFGFVEMPGETRHKIDSSGKYCKKACAASLEKLGVEYIDLYYMHRANKETPIEETIRAMAELKAEGKIKYIGLSEVSSTTLRRACKIAHVDAVQIEYAPFVLDIEGATGTNLLATCRELGTLTKEIITGKADLRTMLPRFESENFEANQKAIQHFKALAEQKGCTPAQLALAWLMKQGNDIIPIPGTKKIKYLEENWDSLKVTLTDSEEMEIRQAIESVDMAGHRTVDYDATFADTREE